jgi:hypothetical protein
MWLPGHGLSYGQDAVPRGVVLLKVLPDKEYGVEGRGMSKVAPIPYPGGSTRLFKAKVNLHVVAHQDVAVLVGLLFF